MMIYNNKGTILIITLWILAILAILSVGIAGRMSLELKLAGYHRDSMKALYMAKAAIERAVVEKQKDDEEEKNGQSLKADTLNESWANKPEFFDDQDPFHDYIDGQMPSSSYTIKYRYKENKEAEAVELYGMMDEASKLNINEIIKGTQNEQVEKQERLVKLLEYACGIPPDDARPKVYALIDWMDDNPYVIDSPAETEDNKYYSEAGGSYCKNAPLDSLEELLLLEGFFDSDILYGNKTSTGDKKYGIIGYITIYTDDDKVNVNTTSKEVLMASGFSDSSAKNIINFRKSGGVTGEEGNTAIGEGDLTLSFFNSNMAINLTTDPSAEEIITKRLTATSNTFRIYATGKANKAEKRIECVVKVDSGKAPEFKYWQEN